jgi:hypothetical protein
MTDKKHLSELSTEFDRLRFSEQGLPIDSGVITQRPNGPQDKLIITIQTGIAAGSEAFAMTEDFPGIGHERALFSSRARVTRQISFKLHIVNSIGIRVRPLPIEP